MDNESMLEYNINCCNAYVESKKRQCALHIKHDIGDIKLCSIHKKQYDLGKLKRTVLDIGKEKPEEKEPPKKKIRISKLSKRELFLKRFGKYIEHTDKIVILQKMTRGYLVRNNIYMKGHSLYNRSLVNNETDFLSFSDIKDIPNHKFFSYRDSSDFVWGFDIATFKELINNSNNECINPYNNQKIDSDILDKFGILLRNMEKKAVIEVEKAVIKDPFLKMQQKCIRVFQKMDNLEQYTQCEWFTELGLNQLKELYKQMLDIWDYRTNLTEIEKKNYVKNGRLFTESVLSINKCTDKIKLANILLDDFEKLVDQGKTRADKTTGALWILSGLTLVSLGARDALPWLFQSANVY